MSDQYNKSKDDRQGFREDIELTKEELEANQTTTAQAYLDGLNIFSLQGYRLVPDMAGQFAFHRVYRLSKPRKIKGILYPDGFKVWTEVATLSQITLFQSIVQDYIQEDPKGRSLWLPIIQPDPAKRRPLYAHAQSLVSLQTVANKQSTEPINYGVDPYPRLCGPDESPAEVAPRAYVPQSDWFAPQLSELTIDHLLSLFPKAERQLLALCIGRACVGQSNAKTPSGMLVKHTSRMAALVLGKDPGLGKSTLFEKLWAALESTGYIVETFSKMGARFNLGPVATADIIYKDDITSKGLQSFVESENTKIIITGNGLLKVEDKGVNAVNVKPCGVIFLNSNEFNPRTVYGIDPGTADRLKMLSTLRKNELESLQINLPSGHSFPAYPEVLFKQLAKHYKVSERAIMLWLARLCIDYFWQTIQVNEEQPNVNQLKNEVHYWTHLLRTPLHKNATAQVLSLFTMIAFGCMTNSSARNALKMQNRQDVSISSINWKNYHTAFASFIITKECLPYHAFLRWHFEEIQPTNEFHPYLGLKIISGPHVKQSHTEISSAIESPEIICEIMDELKLTQGLPLSKDYVWLNESWHTITPMLTELRTLWKSMEEIIDSLELKEAHGLILAMEGERTEMLGHQLALDQFYTPEMVNRIATAYQMYHQ